MFSERGPLSGAPINIQAGMWALRTGGTILAETLGESNGAEWSATGSRAPEQPVRRVIDEARTLFYRSCIDIRVAAEFLARRRFPDVYEWLVYHRAGWGDESPVTDDLIARLTSFVQRFAAGDGSIEVTEHRIWIGGVKQPNPPETWEFPFFGEPGETIRAYFRGRSGAEPR